MVGENAWYDFSFLKFTEVCIVAQHVSYPGECCMCTSEECVFSAAFGWNALEISIKSICSYVSFKACISLLILFLDDLSIDESGVLKAPIITLLLSISPFMAVC